MSRSLARTRPLWSGAALGLSLFLKAPLAYAELPPEGTRLTTSHYTIDLAQTPVLSGTRVTGLAGAFVAIGEGTDGSAQNPAAVAHRVPWSNSHFDVDLSLGITFSSAILNTDLFNSGQRVVANGGDESFVFLNLAANLQFGRWGFGLSSDIQEYALRRATGATGGQEDELLARFAVTHATAAYAFHRGELLIGLGTRSITLNVDNENAPTGGEQDLFEAFGTGYELGVLIRPNDTRFRIGASFRTAVTARASRDGRVLYSGDPEDELWLPARVTLPWDLNAGFALQLGPRPFNPRWLDPTEELEAVQRYLDWRSRERARRRAEVERHTARAGRNVTAAVRAVDVDLETEALLDELYLERVERELAARLNQRYRRMERFYFLITSSFEMLGPVDDAVGVESFLQRRVQRSGTSVTISPRLGLETEAIPSWTRLRVGSYLEPTRFEANTRGARVHGTFGIEQRVFGSEVFGLLPEDSKFRVSGSVDMARAFFSWGVAIGLWH